VPRTPLRRITALAVLTGLGLAIGAGVASAHVTVNPNTAVAGSYSALTFRVPNESATAKTTQLVVNFPTDHPLASVSVKKQPGWTATVTTSKLANPVSDDDNATITQAVSSITWKADSGFEIGLGEFAEFEVSVGPIPNVPSLSFPSDQTYSDGTVVKWVEPRTAGAAEPEHPAPLLTITQAAATSGSAAPSSAGADPTVTVTAAASGSGGSTSDGTARALGVVGIVVGALGLLAGAFGISRRRTAR
jgi:periplasmic copper chaperone A